MSSINQGSSLLKASKVQIDGVAQTLEVAFNVLKTQADGTKSQTESNTTAISVAQGKINTLIQDTTITKDGQTVKLKDEYSKLEQTVGSLSSTIGKQQTTIDDHSGKITATNSEISSLKQNINGLSASVSTAETTIQSHTQQLAQKANTSDVDAKINSIQIGGRNYILSSDKYLSVSTAETTIQSHTQQLAQKANTSDVDAKINSIQIGGRNYILSSDKYLESMTPTNVHVGRLSNTEDVRGKAITVSLEIDVVGMSNVENQANRIGYEMSIHYTDGTVTYVGVWHSVTEGNFKGRKARAYEQLPDKEIRSIAYSGLSIHYTDGTVTYVGVWHSVTEGNFKGRKARAYEQLPDKEIRSIAYSGLHIQCNATKCKIGRPKIEIGNKATDWSPAPEDIQASIDAKATDWSPAPEDIQASIDAKANSTDVYKKTETYTKGETDSQINIAKDSITQSVASTYETKTNVESKVNGVKSSVTNLESRVNKAEQKITDSAIISTVQNTINTAKTEAINSANSNTANQLKNYSTTQQMNSAINQKANEITSSVSQTYATKGEVSGNYATKSELTQTTTDFTFKQMNSAINQKANEITSSVSQTYATKGEVSGNYATKSELTQTTTDFTFKLQNSGGYNVIRNGNALNGQAYWNPYWLPSATWGVRNDEWSGYVPCFQINNPTGANQYNIIYQSVPTVVGKTYTASALVAGHRAENYIVIVNGSGTAEISASDRAINVYGGADAKDWKRVSTTFVATESTMQIRLYSYPWGGHANNYGWFREVQIEEGTVVTNFSPNPSEVYNGITRIDSEGVHVSHTQDGSTSHMGAHGFTHFVGGTNRKYHSLMFCDSIGQTDSWGNVSMRYRLPSEFWGKKFEVLPSLVHVGFDRDVAHAFKNLNISVHDFDHANGYFSITCTPIGVDVNGSWAVNASTSRRDVAHAFKNLNISVHDFDHANGYFSITCTPIGVDVNGSWAVNASTSRVSFIAIA